MKALANNRLSILQIAVFIFLIFISNSPAQVIDDSTFKKNIKVGLALGGGGARGIAHIGVIKALEEQGIHIDLIAGTSIGSIIGGLYAAGYSSTEQLKIVKQIDWKNIFNEQPDPEVELVGTRYGIMEPLFRLRFKLWKIYLPIGFNNGQKISTELFKYTAAAGFAAGSDFNKLAIPFRAVAVDTSTGKAAILAKGELAQALRASMAIPMVFNPAYFKDQLYIDGGVIDNLPTDVVKQMGADVVIACDLDELFPLKEEPENIVDVARHTLDITTLELKKKNVKLADILIRPDLKGHSIFNYSDFDSLVEYGYQAAMEKMDEIKKLVFLQEGKRSALKYTLDDKKLDRAVIKRINVIGLTHVRQPVVTSEFPLMEGESYNSELAVQGIQRIYATGLFENVWLELDNLDNSLVGINIHVIEKYPRTVGFGANYREDEGPGGFIQIIHFNLLGWGERFMPFIRYGKVYKRAGLEIVNDRFLGTPITLNNGIYYEQESPYLYNNDGVPAGQMELSRIMGKFSAGTHLYRKLLFMAGLRGERVWLEENQQLGLSAETLTNAGVFGKILFDNTDDRYFPHRGVRLSLKGEVTEDVFSWDQLYAKFEGDLDFHIPLSKKQTVSISAFAGTSIKGLPVYENFKIGGPSSLPGYQRDELWGEHAFVSRLNYRIELLKHLYLQANFSIGTIGNSDISFKDSVKGIAAGLSADSPLGPVNISYGWNGDDRNQLYISLGYDF